MIIMLTMMLMVMMMVMLRMTKMTTTTMMMMMAMMMIMTTTVMIMMMTTTTMVMIVMLLLLLLLLLLIMMMIMTTMMTMIMMILILVVLVAVVVMVMKRWWRQCHLIHLENYFRAIYIYIYTLLAQKVVTLPLKTIKPMWIELLCFHLAEIFMICTRDCSPTKSDTTMGLELRNHSIGGRSPKSIFTLWQLWINIGIFFQKFFWLFEQCPVQPLWVLGMRCLHLPVRALSKVLLLPVWVWLVLPSTAYSKGMLPLDLWCQASLQGLPERRHLGKTGIAEDGPTGSFLECSGLDGADEKFVRNEGWSHNG